MKATAKKRKNGVYRGILILMMVVLLATGCEQNSPLPPEEDAGNPSVGLEDGFQSSNGCDDSPRYLCAYRSDKTEFNIDDVTLVFYYGGYYYNGVEYELENLYDFPYFDLYFSDGGGERYFVKRVEENFVSEKYNIHFTYDENWNVVERTFNHSEVITIPKEIFKDESGRIYFAVYSANVREAAPRFRSIASIGIFYKVIGEKVVLSSNEIK